MDSVEAGVVQGSIPGTLVGWYAELTKGVVGNALKCDGFDYPCMNYGEHFDKCYHNPDMCTEGITMSFWVSQINYRGEIYRAGAVPNGGVGYLIDFPNPTFIGFHTFHNTSHDSYTMDGWEGDGQWRYLLITWYLGEGITVYINGCDADPEKNKGYAKTESRRGPNTIKEPILIGQAIAMNAYLMLDEFLIWHKRLSPEQIWQLYTQGGKVLG